MSIQGDIARENAVQEICKKLIAKMEKHPEAVPVLKELGLEILEELPATTDWSRNLEKTFRSNSIF